MITFDQLYRPAVGVDDALRPLLERFFTELHRSPTDLAALKVGIVAVLEFLGSARGRTDANCRAVNFFLMRDEAWNDDKFPQAFVDILADMAGALHDTVTAPDIATNFESTPEQLLERARRLESA